MRPGVARIISAPAGGADACLAREMDNTKSTRKTMGVVCAADRSNIFKLVVGMFNAAPGASYLAEFS